MIHYATYLVKTTFIFHWTGFDETFGKKKKTTNTSTTVSHLEPTQFNMALPTYIGYNLLKITDNEVKIMWQ